MTFKRCKKCMEEIHTTVDGREIDHAPECPDAIDTKQMDDFDYAGGDEFAGEKDENSKASK